MTPGQMLGWRMNPYQVIAPPYLGGARETFRKSVEVFYRRFHEHKYGHDCSIAMFYYIPVVKLMERMHRK